jgi:large subunit ribosomal protein L25
MSDNIQLNAEPREDSGKGASRRLRHTGMVPAVVYGGDNAPISIMLQHNVFLHALDNEAIYTQLIDLKVGKKSEEVVLRDLQRHPYKNKIMHADFFRIDNKVAINVTVPVHTLNADDCVGVKIDGGMLSLMMSEIDVICLPKDIPEYLEIDVAELQLGETIHLSQIKMPNGVEIVALTHDEDGEHDIGVVSVMKTRAEVVSDEAPEAPEQEDAAEGDSEDS